MPGWKTRGSGAATTRGRSLAMSRRCDDRLSCDRLATDHFRLHSRLHGFANDRVRGGAHADDGIAPSAAIARATFGWMRVVSCLFAFAVASGGACDYPALPLLEDFAPAQLAFTAPPKTGTAQRPLDMVTV